MLYFRNPARSANIPNYASRSSQRKLLGLVMLVGLLLLVLFEASNPDNYAGVAQFFAQDVADEPSIDIVPPEPSTSAPLVIAQANPSEAGASKQASQRLATRHRKLADIDPAWLEAARDDSRFLPSETHGTFALLDLLRHTPQDEIDEHSSGPISLAQLMKQPNAYRGELVTLRGTARRAYPHATPPNDFEIDEYTQLWVQPTGNPGSPVVVYCLDLPPDFPTGEGLSADITLTGLFYKRWLYEGQDRLYIAPLLLAKGFTWHPEPPPQEDSLVAIRRQWPLILGGSLLIAGACLWFALRQPTYDRVEPTTNNLLTRRGSLENLRDLDIAPDVREALGQLSQPNATSATDAPDYHTREPNA